MNKTDHNFKVNQLVNYSVDQTAEELASNDKTLLINASLLKVLQNAFKALGFLIIAWLLGFLVFIYTLPTHPQKIEKQTDAIVAWTGGPCRVSTAVELLSQGVANKLFVSGIPGTNPQLIIKKCRSRIFDKELRALRPRISLGSAAQSTTGNAIETAHWVNANSIKSVRLVTTAIHLPRSLLEFKRYMPSIELLYHPVSLTQFNHFDWYKDLSVFKKSFLEYNKYLIIKMGIRIQWRDNLVE